MYLSSLHWYQLSRNHIILKTKANCWWKLQNLFLKHCKSETRLNLLRVRLFFCLQTSDGPKVQIVIVLIWYLHTQCSGCREHPTPSAQLTLPLDFAKWDQLPLCESVLPSALAEPHCVWLGDVQGTGAENTEAEIWAVVLTTLPSCTSEKVSLIRNTEPLRLGKNTQIILSNHQRISTVSRTIG